MHDVLVSFKYYLTGAIQIVEFGLRILRYVDMLVDSLIIVQSLREDKRNGTTDI